MTRRERDLFKQRYHGILYGSFTSSDPKQIAAWETKLAWVEEMLAKPIDPEPENA